MSSPSNSDSPKQGFSCTKFFLGLPADFLIACLIIGMLCIMAASSNWIADLFTHFRVYYVIAGLIAFLIELALWRKWHAIVALALTSWHLISIVPYYLEPPKAILQETAADTKHEFKVLLVNLHLENDNTAAVIDLIRDEKPDIVLLQEVTPTWEQSLRALGTEFSYQIEESRDSPFGIWLLSNARIVEHKIFPDGSAGCPAFTARLDVNGMALQLVGLHPFPPIGGANSKQRNEWLDFAEREARAAFENGVPAVVLGDLNATPWTPHFKNLGQRGRLRDSALGHGLQPSWSAPRAGFIKLPIDHCLVSREIAVLERRLGPDIGSDHRPVIIRCAFSKDVGPPIQPR